MWLCPAFLSFTCWPITAGLPMPKLYVINDPVPNAFATGRDPKHAVIAVTTGLLERIEKNEIEGVVAHEMAFQLTRGGHAVEFVGLFDTHNPAVPARATGDHALFTCSIETIAQIRSRRFICRDSIASPSRSRCR